MNLEAAASGGDSNGVPRILLVINRLEEHGGTEVSTALLLDRLHGQGIDLGVLTLFGEPEPFRREDLQRRGVRFYTSGPGFRSQWQALSVTLQKFRPDFVHAQLVDAEFVARLAAIRFGFPVLGTILNMQYSDSAFALHPSPRRLAVVQRVDGWLARHATVHFHALTQAAAADAVRALGIPPERITVVHRGRDPAVLRKRTPLRRGAAREGLGIGEQTPVLLNVGRQVAQKGHTHLLRAFEQILASHPGAVLLIAGREGPVTPQLQEQVHKSGLQEQVRFLGVRYDVPELLCAADIFVFTSAYEGLGAALIESMALECPVVAFGIPPVREVLGPAGVLVPPGDVDQFAKEVVQLLDNPQQHQELARLGRRRFEERFTADRYVQGMRDLYLNVLDRAQQSRRWRRRRR